MKLYSSRQVAGVSVASVMAVVALLLAFGLLHLPQRDSAGAQAPAGRVVAAGTEEVPVTPKTGSGPSVRERPTKGGELWSTNAFSGLTEDEKNSVTIYETLNAGVVNITATTVQYDWFLNPVPQEGTGSGSILDQEGHILTNYHVVKEADKLSVTLSDGSEFEARIVGVDPQNDLAVIRIDPKGKHLTVIPFGSSARLMVGQKVLAIGNPFGLERTLTTGVVSGLGRPIRNEDGYIIRQAIQTDASINPGNSGGPLLDSSGNMIGINSSIYSVSGGSIGLGFAVPVDTAKRVVPDLVRYGKVRRGWLGIDVRDLVQLNRRIAAYAGLPVAEGLLVSRVPPGSAAARAGIRGGSARSRLQYGRSILAFGGDIIVEVDGVATKTLADLFSALEDNKPGDEVVVKVIRDRKVLQFTVTLDPMR